MMDIYTKVKKISKMEKYLISNNKTDGEKNYVHEDISDG